jgi:prophage regulatory protein
MRKNKLMVLSEVLEETKMGKTKLYALVKEGRFPRQRGHGNGSVVWVRSEVEEWIECLIMEINYKTEPTKVQ